MYCPNCRSHKIKIRKINVCTECGCAFVIVTKGKEVEYCCYDECTKCNLITYIVNLELGLCKECNDDKGLQE